MEEGTVTPFVSESERGDLLSSEDSELSEGEVKRVLLFLHQSGDNTKLSLKELTLKLAMLLALVLARWSSDVVRLSVQGVHEFSRGS